MNDRPVSFSISSRDATSNARAGTLTTPHGVIQTPAFVPVGTKASVKGVMPDTLAALGAQVVLANTYHLYLQPGEEIVRKAGGLAAFMGWKRSLAGQGSTLDHGSRSRSNLDRFDQTQSMPTITDSGGFQVFSLGAAFDGERGKKVTHVAEEDKNTDTSRATVYDEDVQTQHGQLAIIDEEGVTFTSHLDGSLHRFTPERSVELQHTLGADIFFAFDECTSPTEEYQYQKEAMFRTHRWADRSLKAHRQNLEANKRQAIYGIGQGGQFDDLRRESTRAIAEMGFDGFGLGGSFSTAYGDSMLPLALSMLEELPEDMPRHGLGVGEPGDLLRAIAGGVDTFDCVAPTRHGRHGTIYTARGLVRLKREEFLSDFGPLDPDGIVPGTEHFSRSYVSHLLRAGELSGQIIASVHNLGFILKLVDGAREAIHNGTFTAYRENFEKRYYA